mgnify:CR=1 FL=1
MSVWEGLIDSLHELCPADAQHELAAYRSVFADLESCTTWQSVFHRLHHELISGRLASERSSHAFWSNQKVDYLSSPTLDGLVYGHSVALSCQSREPDNHAFVLYGEAFTDRPRIRKSCVEYRVIPHRSICEQLEMETAFVIGVIRSGKAKALQFLLDRSLELTQVAYARKFAALSCSKSMCQLVFSLTMEQSISVILSSGIETMEQLEFAMDQGYLDNCGYANLLSFAVDDLSHNVKVWSEFVCKIMDRVTPKACCLGLTYNFQFAFENACIDVLSRVIPTLHHFNDLNIIDYVNYRSMQPMASMHYLVHCKVVPREELSMIRPRTPEIVRMMCRAKVPFSPPMIFELIREGRMDAAKTLIANIKGLDQYEPETSSENPFVVAIRHKDPSLIRLFLKRGALPSMRGYEAYRKYHAMPGYKKLAKMVAPP